MELICSASLKIARLSWNLQSEASLRAISCVCNCSVVGEEAIFLKSDDELYHNSPTINNTYIWRNASKPEQGAQFIQSLTSENAQRARGISASTYRDRLVHTFLRFSLLMQSISLILLNFHQNKNIFLNKRVKYKIKSPADAC